MKSISTKYILSLTSLLLLSAHPASSADIDVNQAQSMNQQGALLLDVREVEEYNEIHAPNAMLIPLGQLNSRIQEISAYKNKPIAVMCRSGRRSEKAVHLLQEAGFLRVDNVTGGMLAWQKSGLKTDSSQYVQLMKRPPL